MAAPDWKFAFTSAGEKDLRALDAPIQKRVVGKLEWLRGNFPLIVIEPLGREWRGYFKVRVGDWRVVYDVDYELHAVTVHRIQLRDKVYKKQRR